MNIDGKAERYTGLRAHVRTTKGGKTTTYYFYDRRALGLPDIPLGSDHRLAVELWKDARAGVNMRKPVKPRMMKAATPGRRRKIGSESWPKLPRWAQRMYLNAERRARECNRAFAITVDEFAELIERANGRCTVSGVQMDMEAAEALTRAPFAPSIDRIDCARGYVPGNVRIVCLIVNVAMNSWGEAPLRKLAESLLGVPQIRR